MSHSGIVREPFRPSRAPADQGAGNEGAGMGSGSYLSCFEFITHVSRRARAAE